jgi:hypothetical protein
MRVARSFSRTFPAYHRKKTEQTFFVERILNQLKIPYRSDWYFYELVKLNPTVDERLLVAFYESLEWKFYDTKSHTIREKHHFKAGDVLIPKVWSSKPYWSKPIQFAPEINIPKVWNLEVKDQKFYKDTNEFKVDNIDLLAQNDGLLLEDFLEWFKYPKPFDGQIICWNPELKY